MLKWVKKTCIHPVGAGISVFIISQILIAIWGVIKNISFSEINNKLVGWIGISPIYNSLIFWGTTIIFLILFLVLLKKYIVKFKQEDRSIKFESKNSHTTQSSKIIEKPDPITPIVAEQIETVPNHSTVLFAQRIADAFPGQRGIKWYDSKVAVERLAIFFKKQYVFPKSTPECVSDPFWWFRGGQAEALRNFKVISKTKVLINWDELEIKRMAVNYDANYYKCYIYIETNAEKPIGINNISQEKISDSVHMFGFAHEEYAISENHIITIQEYDDGGYVRKGKVYKTHNSELRVRYLSPYNVLICAKQAPYNSPQFSRETPVLFNGIVKGEIVPEVLFQHLEIYPKPYW